jgi:hypothetical protein
MKRLIGIATLCIIVSAAMASAQPTLESLWPNPEGLRFEYLYHRIDLLEDLDFSGEAYLGLEGTTMTPGGEAQNLIGGHIQPPSLPKFARPEFGPLLASVWRARPDLRPVIEAFQVSKTKTDYWAPLFLHTGYFMKSADKMEMWQDIWLHSTWTYLVGEPSVGSSFTHQLVPELADDIYLHGEVTAINATVVTENATYTNAVKVTYLVDMGVSSNTDENGNLLFTAHSEYRGHVHFVPDVGPVEMLQEYEPFVWIDCDGAPCPEDYLQWVGQVTETQTLSLLQGPVSTEMLNLGSVKALYR